MSVRIESFKYDDAIVRKFAAATILWGIVGMLVGVIAALQLVVPEANFGQFWLTFGRLRPLHTNAVVFAFAGNALFTAVYYSSQRLLKARMFSDVLSKIHFWGWQLIIVSAAITLPLGFTAGKEYAELEWPIDIAIALIWVVFAVNFFGTLWRRREKHLYVAIWFYVASIVTVAILHIFNSLEIPAGPLKSYSVYAGAQDAFMQWWYGHNAVAFFLTTPFLGLMYYFLPKAANRPVFSYRLSILHFWGGMVNGLLTLRGAWNKVAEDPVLKFFVAGVTFYGLSTFEGPLLSIKSVNALSHYTDWTIGHVHGGALGWNGLMTAGMIYWLAPRLFQTKQIWSKKLMDLHFWTAIVGLLLYVVSMWVAGITQGLMWREFDEAGRLANKDFLETVTQLRPEYIVRLVGGVIFLGSMVMMAVNVVMTWRRRPAKYEEPVHEAPALAKAQPQPVKAEGSAWRRLVSAKWHRRWEALPVTFTVAAAVAVIVASLFEIIPTFLIKSNIATISSVHPYTPLELYGRDIYLREGCYNCHSQMVRPIRSETERYGEYSKAGEFVYDHPFQWGSRRIGPDLHRVGGKFNDVWHVLHLENPRQMPGAESSIMPAYPWMLSDTIDFDVFPTRVKVMAMLGVPYTDAAVQSAAADARGQAELLAARIVTQGGPSGLADKDLVALVAYLQRLGTDIKNAPAGGVPSEVRAAVAAPDATPHKEL